jgi:hypothetical protein
MHPALSRLTMSLPQPARPGVPSRPDMQEYKSLPASLDVDDSDFDVLSWEVQPGDAIAFHMRTLHAAARCAFRFWRWMELCLFSSPPHRILSSNIPTYILLLTSCVSSQHHRAGPSPPRVCRALARVRVHEVLPLAPPACSSFHALRLFPSCTRLDDPLNCHSLPQR